MDEFEQVEPRPGAQLLLRWEQVNLVVKFWVESTTSLFRVNTLTAYNSRPERESPVGLVDEHKWVSFFQLEDNVMYPTWTVIEFDEETYVLVRVRHEEPEIAMALGVHVTLEKREEKL